MSTKADSIKDYTGHQVVITREFAASRMLVFKAWTDPYLLAQWWGPKGFTNPVCEWEARPGAKIYVVMRGPNGAEYPMGGTFREVVEPERLVFTSGALDEKGELVFELLHTITFAELNGKTTVNVHSRVISTTSDAAKYLGGYEAGMTQSLERLAALVLPPPGPLIVERVLNAPVDLVWKAITTPEAIQEWFFEMPGFKAETGAKFQFTVEHNHFTYVHLCEVVEVIPGKKLAHTWRYDGHEGDSLVTYELFAEGNKTRLKLTHTGLDTFPKVPAFAKTNFMGGWTALIGSSLKEFVEKAVSPGASPELVITRIFDAPRELVFKAWTNPEHLIQWFKPKGAATPSVKCDPRVGGKYRLQTRQADGEYYTAVGTYQEVKAPERLVFTWAFEKDGSGTEYGEVEPNESLVTIEFQALGKQTKMVFTHQKFASVESRDRHQEGWTSCLDQLDAFLKSK